ncbi:MAG: hypothetical protein ACNA8W_18420 [Bradymonadaceae bacterium]
MTNDIEEDVDESFEDFDDGFEADLDEDLDVEDFDEEEDEEFTSSPKPSADDDILDKTFEGAVRANPKRMSAAQRKKAASVIEGIISDAELSSPKGQSKAWAKLNKKSGGRSARPYAIATELTENDVVDHPRFGIGYVIQILSPTKVEVLFEEGVKRLVHNQKR